MMIEHGGHDQRPVEDGSEEEGVPELCELVAEAAVGGVPEKAITSGGSGADVTLWGDGS